MHSSQYSSKHTSFSIKTTALLFCIYSVTIPVLLTVLIDLFQLPTAVQTESLTIPVSILGFVGIALSLFLKKWPALLSFVPIVYYYSELGLYGGLQWWVIVISTVYAFIYMLINGHIRSLLFLFLIAYSAYASDFQMAMAHGFMYAFLRFIYLAVDQNLDIFRTLGFNKSFIQLSKSLLFWSPLLIFIIPIKHCSSSIKDSIADEIYNNTFVDSVEFYRNEDKILQTRNFQLCPNKTTVIFLDSNTTISETSLNSHYISETLSEAVKTDAIEHSHKWMIKQFVDTNLMENAKDHFYSRYVLEKLSGKESPILETYFSDNIIDFNLMDDFDTVSSSTFAWVLSRRERLRSYHMAIGTNKVFYTKNANKDLHQNNMIITQLQNAVPANKNNIAYESLPQQNILNGIITQKQKLTLNNKSHHIQSPSILILKDIALKSKDTDDGSMYDNSNCALIYSIKHFTNTVIEKINNETGPLNIGLTAQELNHSVDSLPESVRNDPEAMHKYMTDRVNDKRDECKQKINKHKTATLTTINKQLDTLFPEPFLKVEECEWYDVTGHVNNGLKKAINIEYSKKKYTAKQKIDSNITAVYKNIHKKADEQFDNAIKSIDKKHSDISWSEHPNDNDAEQLAESLQTADFSSLNSLDQMIPDMLHKTSASILASLLKANHILFIAVFIYSFIGTIAFLYLIIQTFLYVFARVTVSKKHNVYVTLSKHNENHPKGRIKKCGDEYSITGDSDELFYVSRKFEPSGCPPHFAIPNKWSLIPSRIKSKVYFMNKVDMKKRNDTVHFRTTGSQEFIEWELTESEEVVFNLKDLVAMTASLELKSEINLQITTLILGKLFHKVVKGPGKLVLLSEGRPIITGEHSSDASLAQNRIIAFNKGTRFEIDSQLNILDVYMSGFYLKKMDEDMIVIDADAHGKPSVGLIQYVKKLIMPF